VTNSHFGKCRVHVLDYADGLAESIRAGRLNESAFPSLIKSYLEQPAYYESDRDELYDLAYERIVGHRPEDGMSRRMVP
jgi:hypothetical protein